MNNREWAMGEFKKNRVNRNHVDLLENLVKQ